jgi:hypothetical protein
VPESASRLQKVGSSAETSIPIVFAPGEKITWRKFHGKVVGMSASGKRAEIKVWIPSTRHPLVGDWHLTWVQPKSLERGHV